MPAFAPTSRRSYGGLPGPRRRRGTRSGGRNGTNDDKTKGKCLVVVSISAFLRRLGGRDLLVVE